VPGDGTLRALGKCADVAHGGTADHTLVQLWDCNGTGSQTWITQPDGALLNPQSGRCLDDPDGTGAAGDRLQIYGCNSTPAQQFRLGT
ncbi:MAG TPA: ricin-type beta-trefoil lectin domain protein, partial [Amycolatopsis sp.]|nr:ricin-type beta-trefoil lectin domain protein [Amycolatopsis sp.]